MTQKDRFTLTMAMMIFAYGFALKDMTSAALLLALAAAFLSVISHSFKILNNAFRPIVMIYAAEIFLSGYSGLLSEVPELIVLFPITLIAAYTWNVSSYKATGSVMKVMLISAGVFYLAAFLMPVLNYGFFNTLLLVSAVFMPSCTLYLVKEYRYRKAIAGRRVLRAVQ